MTNPRLSLIIPCFNGAKYIRECISNVLEQDIMDFEIIIVDDGSIDNSLSLLREYEERDNRIIVIGQENGGVSCARNCGLKAAKGEWILFLDIDDTLMPKSLSYLLNCVRESDELGFVMAGYIVIKNDISTIEAPILKKSIINNIELTKELFAPSDFPYQGYICSKLYRRSIIEKHNIRFDESIKYNEDRLFTFRYLSYIKQGVYTTKPVYNYIQHGDNAMSAIEGPNFWKFETDLDAFLEMSKIAPAYNSKEIERLVKLGTIASYKWNRRLNKKYGANNKEMNLRLKRKLLSAVPRGFLYRERCKEFYHEFKSKLYAVAVKTGIK